MQKYLDNAGRHPVRGEEPPGRRPLRSRGTVWAVRAAGALAASSVTPNQISTASMLFASAAGLLLAFSPNALMLFAAAFCIQSRLLCNLFDGMVAVEGGKKTAHGDLYNEMPDRVSDAAIFIGMGYGAGDGWAWLGWFTALCAVGTAYVRAFGASLCCGQDFSGPFAKPQRMALATAACLAGMAEYTLWGSRLSLAACLVIAGAGTAVTVALRTRNLARALETRTVPGQADGKAGSSASPGRDGIPPHGTP